MHAAIATQAGSPDAANEDWAGVAAPGLAVVLDGLSAPDGTGTGCRHGTPWFVSQLGPRLLTLAAEPANSPADALAEAIRQVAGLHPGCDLTHPGTPSATLVLLRVLDERTDYLALADAVLLLDTADGLKVISDERVNQLAGMVRAAATGCLPAQPSSSGDAPSSPGHSDGHATDPAGTGSPPPIPRPPAKPSPARSPAGACIAPRCSATAPADSSTHSSSPPGRNCSRCWMRAARTSCSARSGPPKPSTPKAGNGPGLNAATTPPPSTSSADQAAWDELQAAGWTARVR
jgi:hypothetical protein